MIPHLTANWLSFIPFSSQDWTLCLAVIGILTRHLVSSAPLTTDASPTPSVDFNVTTSGNYSEGHLEDGQPMTIVPVDETKATTDHRTHTEDGDTEVSEELHLQTVTMSAQPPSDDALQTTQIPEASNTVNIPEVSYTSPVDDRCISAKLVEAIEGNTQLQNLAKRDSVCKWKYVYDVNPKRVPELLMKAECQTSNLPMPENETSECQTVLFYVAVKKMDESEHWVDHFESLPVACVLANRASDSRTVFGVTEGEEHSGPFDADVTETPYESTPDQDSSEDQGYVSITLPDSNESKNQTANEEDYSI